MTVSGNPSGRLGIFGGAFDPIHLAHLRLAEEAREACRLDRVLFLPTPHPPHKTPPALGASFSHRLAMTRCAVADHPAFVVSDFEARRGGKSYSVETLELLRTVYPGQEFFFLIGMDSFRDLATWWEYRRIFALTNLIVIRRPGVEEGGLLDFLPVAVRGEFCYDSAEKSLVHQSGTRVIPLVETYLDVSSTGIRQMLANGRSVRYLLPPPVLDYIAEHGLYRGAERL